MPSSHRQGTHWPMAPKLTHAPQRTRCGRPVRGILQGYRMEEAPIGATVCGQPVSTEGKNQPHKASCVTPRNTQNRPSHRGSQGPEVCGRFLWGNGKAKELVGRDLNTNSLGHLGVYVF